MLKAGQSRGSIVCVNGVIIKQSNVVLNQKVLVVKMIPLISRLPREGGQGAMVTRPPPLPHGLKV